MRLSDYLRCAIDANASDLHVTDSSAFLRVNRVLRHIPDPGRGRTDWNWPEIGTYPPELTLAVGTADFALVFGGRTFRVCWSKSHDGYHLVARVIADTVIPYETLGAPPSLLQLFDGEPGLLVFSGPVGSGKSTTLTAVLDFLLDHKSWSINTLEDPIEFLHNSRPTANIVQKQLGVHFSSWDRAISDALRQDVNCLLIGELRTQAALNAALNAAATGMFVLTTAHNTSVRSAIQRLFDLSASPTQEFRASLAGCLRGVLAQRLLPGLSAPLVAAYEYASVSSSFAAHIQENTLQHIDSIILRGASSGMLSLPRSLATLVHSRRLSEDVARGQLHDSSSQDTLRQLLRS